MAKPNRTFTADEGDIITGVAGPEQIVYDFDNLFAMFDPAATLRDGSQGGLSTENFQLGSATDDALGPRTVDPTLAPNAQSQTAPLTQWLSWFANRIQALSGMANWYDTPPSSIVSAFPSGAIAIWSGSVASIPYGWALCDGTHGTPDLRGRFVIGAGGSYAVGAVGGEATHTLSVNEIPSHSHSISVGSAGDHTHSASTNSTGAHTHTYTSDARDNYAFYNDLGSDYQTIVTGDITPNTSTSGAHTHSVTVDTAGAHTHSVTVSNSGGGATHNNMPPYYAFCYIMKL